MIIMKKKYNYFNTNPPLPLRYAQPGDLDFAPLPGGAGPPQAVGGTPCRRPPPLPIPPSRAGARAVSAWPAAADGARWTGSYPGAVGTPPRVCVTD